MRLPSMARRRVLAAPFFLLLITLASCFSLSDRDDHGGMTQNDRLYRGRSGQSHEYADLIKLMRDTAPESGSLKFFAASPRMQNRDQNEKGT